MIWPALPAFDAKLALAEEIVASFCKANCAALTVIEPASAVLSVDAEIVPPFMVTLGAASVIVAGRGNDGVPVTSEEIVLSTSVMPVEAPI